MTFKRQFDIWQKFDIFSDKGKKGEVAPPKYPRNGELCRIESNPPNSDPPPLPLAPVHLIKTSKPFGDTSLTTFFFPRGKNRFRISFTTIVFRYRCENCKMFVLHVYVYVCGRLLRARTRSCLRICLLDHIGHFVRLNRFGRNSFEREREREKYFLTRFRFFTYLSGKIIDASPGTGDFRMCPVNLIGVSRP